jgi:membrane-bound ClpP family serine protease
MKCGESEKTMNGRLILAILSTLLEQAALVVIALWGLPQVGIQLPLAGLIVIMVVWGAFSIFTYRKGSHALRKKPMDGLPAMIGSRGKVVHPLAPEGMVRVKGELWVATSTAERIDTGEKITVLGQDGLRLLVSKSGNSDSKRAK